MRLGDLIARISHADFRANPGPVDLSDIGFEMTDALIAVDEFDPQNEREGHGCIAVDLETKHTVVAFRGSEDLPDWIEDFDASLVAFPNGDAGAVHGGALALYRTLRGVGGNLPQIPTSADDLCVAGYSQGAWLATFFAAENSASELCTFAAPMPGDERFAAYASGRIGSSTRYAVKGDVVTLLPSSLLGFVHPWPARILDVTAEVNHNPISFHLLETYLFGLQKAFGPVDAETAT